MSRYVGWEKMCGREDKTALSGLEGRPWLKGKVLPGAKRYRARNKRALRDVVVEWKPCEWSSEQGRYAEKSPLEG